MAVSRSNVLLSSFPLRSYIAGAFVPTTSNNIDKTYDLYDAATGKKRLESHWASKCQVQDALNATAEAQYDWMINYSIQDRIRIFQSISNQLKKDVNLIAQMESMDTGRTISETSSYDAISASQVLNHYIELLEHHFSKSTQTTIDGSSWSCVRREPLGVTVGIGTWNYPIMNALMKSIPSLAFGNGMIYKPSELTPTAALYLAQVYMDAGVPSGLFNVVLGDKPIVQSLISNEIVEKISFTGSVHVGKQIYQLAASDLKRVDLELGGKSPLLILEDADMDRSVEIAILANWYSNGQVCSNGTRVFVPSSKKDEFIDKLIHRTSQLKIGHPLDPSMDIGPMISKSHLDRVYNYIHTIGCQQDKATLVGNGGQKLEKEGGYYISPAIFINCHDDMQIVKDEIFGMVMCVLTYETEEDVIRRANQTEFGLAAGIVTQNVDYALTNIIPQLHAGVTWINTYNEAPMYLPWSGWKQSGIGSENGTSFAIDSWTQPKSVLLHNTT